MYLSFSIKIDILFFAKMICQMHRICFKTLFLQLNSPRVYHACQIQHSCFFNKTPAQVKPVNVNLFSNIILIKKNRSNEYVKYICACGHTNNFIPNVSFIFIWPVIQLLSKESGKHFSLTQIYLYEQLQYFTIQIYLYGKVQYFTIYYILYADNYFILHKIYHGRQALIQCV